MNPLRQPFAIFLAQLFASIAAGSSSAAPAFVEDQFELPPGFRIYRAASSEVTGGSYALTFDGEGRLLVGDGNAVRRLTDADGDGVFDGYDVIANGLGPRGPQGLLVWGDRLFAVGGDGIQLYEGYRSGRPLMHRGRIGEKFNTGGDHDAHTIFRGHDGFLYFMAGNGAGLEGRRHITEESSPCRVEREASVFRISPDGRRWECVANGGRNPPSLGMNYLGELFSFDSDMEWHVGLPWYRPVRLNHWAVGGDQGWHDVGALPDHYLDAVPAVLNVGRGSPNWGRFYEHAQFPEAYRDAFLVCDYRWKKESNDQYSTTGRLVAFFLQRAGGSWKAALETLARPKPGARDASGQLISFALVDVEVAPDGSLFLTDHNQGVWRLFYDPEKRGPQSTAPAQQAWNRLNQEGRRTSQFDQLLALPQPGAEWSRLREEELRGAFGAGLDERLQETALGSRVPMEKRHRALRLLARDFERLSNEFLVRLAHSPEAEFRGQATWLLGIRQQVNAVPTLIKLLEDSDPFVRRRAAEAFTRLPASAEATAALVNRLGDPDHLVACTAMVALSHRARAGWPSDSADLDTLLQAPFAARARAAMAAGLRTNSVESTPALRKLVSSLLNSVPPATEAHLDLLRVLGRFREALESDAALRRWIEASVSDAFPDSNRLVRWEQARLIGEYRFDSAARRLLEALEAERDPVTQFHLAQAASRLRPGGWTSEDRARLVRWFLGTQRGWFTEFAGKGVEFPESWLTVLTGFADHHREALLRHLPEIDFGSQLGIAALDLITTNPGGAQTLLDLYRKHTRLEARINLARALRRAPSREGAQFLLEEFPRAHDPQLRGAVLEGLAAQPFDAGSAPVLIEGLRHESNEAARASARALGRINAPLDEALAREFITQLAARSSVFHAVEHALAALSGAKREGFHPDGDPNRWANRDEREAGAGFWKGWFRQKFGHDFAPAIAPGTPEQNDEEIHKFILSDAARGGDGNRGAKIYESLGCNSCHGGGVTPGREGRLFGPDLAGIARRLSRQELADALVYPAKQVADRFKAFEVELHDATPLTGFITEQTAETVTLADREQVRRIPRTQIRAMALQSGSLMPSNLFNRLSWEELRDLLAFLNQGAGTDGR